MRAHDDRRLADSLWRFSLALYARAGVAQALIALQDAHGFDINLILLRKSST